MLTEGRFLKATGQGKELQMTGDGAITSTANLTSEQRNFILSQGSNPKDEDDVRRLVSKFNKEFGVRIKWRTMRRLLTNLQRKNRRNGANHKEERERKSKETCTRFNGKGNVVQRIIRKEVKIV